METFKVTLAATCCALSIACVPAIADSTSLEGLMLTPEQLSWKPNPRVAGLEVANILGEASKPGAYVQRVKFPPGMVIKAHTHPDDRTYTVISGTWRIGWGKNFDASELTELPPGSFYTEPANVPHFIALEGEPVVLQISGMGPTSVHYVESAQASK